MHIIVGSTNPVKIAAVRDGFAAVFPDQALTIEGIDAPSGVSDQPMTDAETRQGAEGRAHAARTALPDADYWVGVEGGIAPDRDRLMLFAWIVVVSRDRIGRGRTASFALPDEVAQLVRQGLELGDADDQVFGRTNSKQAEGAVGLLTGNVITRQTYYAPAVILALIPFINPDLTFNS